MSPSGNLRPGGRKGKPGKGKKKSNKEKPLYKRFPKGDPKNPPALRRSIAKSHKCKENRERKKQEIDSYKSKIEAQDSEMAVMRKEMEEKDENISKLEIANRVMKAVLKVLAPELDISNFIQTETIITVLSTATVVITQATPEVHPTADLEPYPVSCENAGVDGVLFQDADNRQFQNMAVVNLLDDAETDSSVHATNLAEQSKSLSPFDSDTMAFNFAATEDDMDLDALEWDTLESFRQSDSQTVDPFFQDEDGAPNSYTDLTFEEESNDLTDLEMDCILGSILPDADDSESLHGALEDILLASTVEGFSDIYGITE